MKKYVALLSVLMGVGSIILLVLGFTLRAGSIGVIGFALLLLSVIVGLVSTALGAGSEVEDPTSRTFNSDEGLQHPTGDKSQLPPGGYTSGHR